MPQTPELNYNIIIVIHKINEQLIHMFHTLRYDVNLINYIFDCIWVYISVYGCTYLQMNEIYYAYLTAISFFCIVDSIYACKYAFKNCIYMQMKNGYIRAI